MESFISKTLLEFVYFVGFINLIIGNNKPDFTWKNHLNLAKVFIVLGVLGLVWEALVYCVSIPGSILLAV